jgi:hypothetical protein
MPDSGDRYWDLTAVEPVDTTSGKHANHPCDVSVVASWTPDSPLARATFEHPELREHLPVKAPNVRWPDIRKTSMKALGFEKRDTEPNR